MNIYVHRNGQQYGPYTPEQVNGYLKSGQLVPTDLAWREGMADWMTLSAILGSVAIQAATEPAAKPVTQPAAQSPVQAVATRPATQPAAQPAKRPAQVLSRPVSDPVKKEPVQVSRQVTRQAVVTEESDSPRSKPLVRGRFKLFQFVFVTFLWFLLFWIVALVLTGIIFGMANPATARTTGTMIGRIVSFPYLLVAYFLSLSLAAAGKLPGTGLKR